LERPARYVNANQFTLEQIEHDRRVSKIAGAPTTCSRSSRRCSTACAGSPINDQNAPGTRAFRIEGKEAYMSESGGTSAQRPKADNDEDAARKDVNPDLHGQAKDVEEKRANDDPETTGA
jgi:hypothetical protein